MTNTPGLWAMWDIFIRLGAAEVLDADISGVENVPGCPAESLGGAQLAIGPLVRLAPTERGDGPSGQEILEREVRPGSVVAIVGNGHDIAVMGSRLAAQALVSGAVGVVTDGKFRDRCDLARMPLAVWSRATTPNGGLVPGSYRRIKESTKLFGLEWQEGDWYAQDSDGALRIAADAVPEVLKRFGKSFRN